MKPAPETDRVDAPAPERAGDEAGEASPPGQAVEASPALEPALGNHGSPVAFVVSTATFLLALSAGEVAYRRSTLPAAIAPTDTYLTKVGAYAQKGGADVVIVGSSRIYHGANSPLLAELASTALGKPITVYNMGVPAGDLPGYSLTVEDVLRKNLKRPSLFIFGMSPIEWTCCPTTSVPSSPKWVAAIRPRHAVPLFLSASDPEEAFTDLTIGLFQSYGARAHVLNQLRRDVLPEGHADPGTFGWVSFGWPVDFVTQEVRASGRAEAYRPNFYAPKHFDAKRSDRYFVAAMDRLSKAGVKIAIVGTPQARQLDRNHQGASFYPEYVAYLTEQAKRRGTEFANFNDFPELTNADFGDGDHLVESGSVKFSRALAEKVIVPALRGQPTTSP